MVNQFQNHPKVMPCSYLFVKQYSHSGFLFMLKARSVAAIVILITINVITHVTIFVMDIQTMKEERNASNKLKYQLS